MGTHPGDTESVFHAHCLMLSETPKWQAHPHTRGTGAWLTDRRGQVGSQGHTNHTPPDTEATPNTARTHTHAERWTHNRHTQTWECRHTPMRSDMSTQNTFTGHRDFHVQIHDCTGTHACAQEGRVHTLTPTATLHHRYRCTHPGTCVETHTHTYSQAGERAGHINTQTHT